MKIHDSVPTLAFAALALVLAGTACEPQARQATEEAAAVDTAAILAAIDSVRGHYEEAFNAGDLERAASIVHPDMIYSPPGHPPIRGRDSVMAYERRSTPPEATIRIEPMETRVVSDEWVYEYGISTVTFTPEGADEEQSVETTYLVILRNTGDGWQTYRESLSSNGPPPDGS